MRFPRPHIVYAFLLATQLVLFVTVIRTHVPSAGVAFQLVLLAGLAYGSGFVWGLLILMNAIPLLSGVAATFSSGGSGGTGSGVLWGNVAVLFLTSVALEATLLSPAMRRHLGRHRRLSAAR
ncbi:MAG TPA: hypothetical protein VG275_09015 [Solirubrobacteraceae bacterium]|jgi:hypothetical protein|nr:hypothetical protein [Solirubrobacteraceae bacterium]